MTHSGDGRCPPNRRQFLAGAAAAGAGAIGLLAACGNRPADDRSRPETLPATVIAPARPGGMPDRVVSMWMFDWRAPSIADLPADVVDTLSMFVVAMAQSAQSGTGRVSWSPNRVSKAEMASQIADVAGTGRPVLIGVGGHQDGGITITDDTQVSEFCASIGAIVREFGFTGVDLDLEPSGSRWTEPALVQMVRTLKAEFGPDFVVGITAALYGEHTARWLSLARELGDSFDFFAHMLYDYVEATDQRLVPDALAKVRRAMDGGIPTHKQVLGFMCNTSTYSSPVAVTGAAWSAVTAEFPDLRGAFIWESSIESSSGYEWTRSVGTAVRS